MSQRDDYPDKSDLFIDPHNYAVYDPDSPISGSHEVEIDLTDTGLPVVHVARHPRYGVPALDAEYRFIPEENMFRQSSLAPDQYPAESLSVDDFTQLLSHLTGVIPATKII